MIRCVNVDADMLVCKYQVSHFAIASTENVLDLEKHVKRALAIELAETILKSQSVLFTKIPNTNNGTSEYIARVGLLGVDSLQEMIKRRVL
jgi:hypothetical protein